jgi:signal peptidase
MLAKTHRQGKAIEAVIKRALTILPPWALIAVWALGVYLLGNVARPGPLEPELSLYLVQPMLWLSLVGVSFFVWHFAVADRPSATLGLVLTGLLVGAFHVALWVLAGLLFGFGNSPYGRSLVVIFGNTMHVGAMLVAVELGRAILVAGLARRPTAALLFASLLLTPLQVPLARWTVVRDPQTLALLTGEVLVPRFAENLLASFLALMGGPLPALAYRGGLQAFEWLSPILPRLPWAITAFVGTLAPALGLLAVHPSLAMNGPRERGGLRGTWPIVGVAAVTLLWFNVGLFGVSPTVVSGASMEPTIAAGDLALIRPAPTAEIDVGDIVRFQYEGMHVIHRVVEIHDQPEGRVFITKGDANDALDPPVLEEHLEGKVVLVIPKVGWVGLAARRLLGWIL